MKKLIICLIMAAITFSCSLPSDSSAETQELLPIENITIPQEFELGVTYEISVTYLRPTTCHAFRDIYYLKQANERTVAVISTVFNGNCTDLTDTELEASFDFKATEPGSYSFKFWKGKDADGEDLYLTVEVPVN